MAEAWRLLVSILLIGLAGLVAACATQPAAPRDIAESPIVIERDLAGANIARGEFRSITGARRRFTAELNGDWDGRVLTLVEEFAFEDGERDRKTWRLERLSSNEWRGTREDVVGYARGYQDGRVFRLEYDLLVGAGNGGRRKVRFRDVLALQREGIVINVATVGWFGLRVGSVRLTMERPATRTMTQ